MIGIIVGLVIAVAGSVATTLVTGADPAIAFLIGIPWGIFGAVVGTAIDD